jgi:hypothetical protein
MVVSLVSVRLAVMVNALSWMSPRQQSFRRVDSR